MNTEHSLASSSPLDLRAVHIQDQYWSSFVNLIRDTVLPYQWEAMNDRIESAEPSHVIRNFRIAAGLEAGNFGGFVFQDTDIYKWLEAVGYSLAVTPDADLELIADEAIALIASAQQEDGYLNTYFAIAEPGNRWTNLMDCHEMYTAGHLIEAAVAYYQGTGKSALLSVAKRLADHIDGQFGDDPGQLRGYDGHQEIELALVKLYEVTGEENYLKLASFLIEERGQQPNYLVEEWEKRGRISHWSPGVVQNNHQDLRYLQAHKPVREQEAATGHAVRAVYMYAAMADLALHLGDESLLAACKRLWSNVVHKQMYITGSIGSTHHGEAFTFDYDLPNDTNYSETCASIGLIFFARRMLQLEPSGEYGDVMERALYNTVTAALAIDGKSFFYVNPLEVFPAAGRGNPGKHHIKSVRQKWFACACCPPNISRLLSSLGQYIFTSGPDVLYTHLYIGTDTTNLTLAGRNVSLRLESGLPWNGHVRLRVASAAGNGVFSIAMRIPSWSDQTAFTLNGSPVEPEIRQGYAYLTHDWQEGDVISLDLDMEPKRIYAHPNVRANAGRVALQRGPLVYCFEEMDNGSSLPNLILPADADIRLVHIGNSVALHAEGFRQEDSDPANASLYRTSSLKLEKQSIYAVPYTQWGNRKPGEMLVWIRE
ncbi:glycoside hydrolase family 127 protein [Paenibacillus lignilyticus]|uniref:Glycoside hydrolase family 127 protein n=1 Tax=Paenibacillus lignilyticus TaxID=1172615 RepID=A0ABS5CDK6_9BACL|nr:beta-L-arabinofuranosidase domain-containing protein [Paenibacillus lignilyticus]MBP3964067.1 glycoside hydrolase family 127 protein [Paenibacillus lignilyticus]